MSDTEEYDTRRKRRFLIARPLSETNAHPRDQRVQFIEDTHTYIIDGDSKKSITSVTTLVHKFFAHFNADAVIEKMSKSPSFPESRYFGMSADDIKLEWERNRDEAATAGTLMHKCIENLNNDRQPYDAFAHGKAIPRDSVPERELELYEQFVQQFVVPNKLKPFRTEWVVFSEQHSLAGSIDMVYKAPDGSLVLADWKRSKKINVNNRYQKGLGPCKHMDDCNLIHYTLQLNLYRQVLEMHYGARVTDMRIVVLHPAQSAPQVYTIPRLEKEIDTMLKTCLKSA